MWRKVLVTALCAMSVTGCAAPGAQPSALSPDTTRSGQPREEPSASPSAAPSPAAPEIAPISYPPDGNRRWRVAPGDAATAGRSGTLLVYRTVVEEGIEGVSPAEFAEEVTGVLSDDRSWTTGGKWRLRRAGPGERYDFTVYLATPGTRDVLCAMGTDRYTSCRNGDDVVLNVARWAEGAAPWRDPLADYRAYLVNHEVGHRLFQGHELCPEPGGPAPVMQQQTLGLHGCTPNAWPYPNGRDRLAGPSGSYDDPLPSS